MNPMFVFFNEREAPRVEDQPAVQVRSWRLVEAPNGDQHLLVVLDHDPLRITSPLAGINKATAELITQSGRRYELSGPPETRELQLSLLTANAARAGLGDSVDISDELWRSIVKA